MPPHSEIQIHTYHCLCTTHLLTTPYPLSSLPHRAPPSLDNAIILPLPALTATSTTSSPPPSSSFLSPNPNPDSPTNEDVIPISSQEEGTKGKGKGNKDKDVLPSLLAPAMRLVRKIVVVRREDGFEKRRVWRCGRCGVGVGYEIVGAGEETDGKDGGRGRVMYLMEGGLRETGELG